MEKTVHLYISIILVLFVDINCAAEEAAPEVFLPPRNFNPHPYEIGYDPSERQNAQPVYENQVDLDPYTRGNTGPVLFPANTPENVTPNPYVTPAKDDHPINRHPYAVVANKKKYSLGLGRFKDEEQVNPQVYRALAAHGARVLKVPQAKDLKDVKIDPSFTNQKKDYAFSYRVADHLTGDDFSHTQSQNSQATNGEYRVKLPDGRVQIVSYTADKNGYKADVKYAENEPANVHYHPGQITKPVNYEYYDDDVPSHAHQNVVQPYYNNYINPQVITATGKPLIYQRDPNQEVRVILTNKYETIPGSFQTYTHDIHEQKVGKFIGSTLAPYTLDSSKGLGQNVAVSTLAPDLDKFNPVYIDAPQYKVAAALHQHYKK